MHLPEPGSNCGFCLEALVNVARLAVLQSQPAPLAGPLVQLPAAHWDLLPGSAMLSRSPT